MTVDASETRHVHVNWSSSQLPPASWVVGRAPSPPAVGEQDVCEARTWHHACGDFGDAPSSKRSGTSGGSTASTRNRRRPLAAPARWPSNGQHGAFRAPRQQLWNHFFRFQTGVPAFRHCRRSVGFDSPWGRPSGTSSTSSSRRSKVRFPHLNHAPALPSHTLACPY